MKNIFRITVKDTNGENITDRECYAYSNYLPYTIHKEEITGTPDRECIAAYLPTVSGDSHILLTDNPTVLTLMVEAGRITITNHHWLVLEDIPEHEIDSFIKLIS